MNNKKPEAAPSAMDAVLRRMLSSSPEPHTQKTAKPKAKPKKSNKKPD